MSNWIDSGGHQRRRCCDAHAGKDDPTGSNSGWKTSLRAASVLVCVLVLAALAAPASRARDPDGRYAAQNPELHKWFDGLKSGKGPCCSDADGTAVPDVDWQSVNGHYRVRLDGEWIDVPDDAVITEPNRIGRTMVWPLRGYLGTTIRCFMPGSMT
jgi:hypothetical protein